MALSKGQKKAVKSRTVRRRRRSHHKRSYVVRSSRLALRFCADADRRFNRGYDQWVSALSLTWLPPVLPDWCYEVVASVNGRPSRRQPLRVPNPITISALEALQFG